MSAEEQAAVETGSRTRPRRSTSVSAPSVQPPPAAIATNGHTPPKAKAAKTKTKQPAVASSPPSPPAQLPQSASPTRRILSPYQRSALEAAFSVCEFISKKTARAIGDKIGIDEPRVIIWFRNKRVQNRKNAEAGGGGAPARSAANGAADITDDDEEDDDDHADDENNAEDEQEAAATAEAEPVTEAATPLPEAATVIEESAAPEPSPAKANGRQRKPKQEYVPKKRKNAAPQPAVPARSTRRSRSNADEEPTAVAESAVTSDTTAVDAAPGEPIDAQHAAPAVAEADSATKLEPVTAAADAPGNAETSAAAAEAAGKLEPSAAPADVQTEPAADPVKTEDDR